MTVPRPQIDDATVARDEGEIARLCEEISDRLRHGEAVDLNAYASHWPQYAAELRQMMPAMQMMAGLKGLAPPDAAAPAVESAVAGKTLGDFRLGHEVGHGGMGIVYEAEQISLRRRVALKVLPFASMVDPRRLQRFKNEVRAAACLNHPNIVPIYAVGCDGGIHYYAMQFIEGLTLEQIIQRLATSGRDSPATVDSSTFPEGSSHTTPMLTDACDAPPRPLVSMTSSVALTPPLASFSAVGSRNGRQWFHAVARLCAQAADALEHAHSVGIVHRDIKPSNLILDENGNLWITDLGLAHIESEGSLTMTGDLLGTIRYMSPEQARGDYRSVDHRADIYSLGITFYELLTLEPAFSDSNRHELLRRVTADEPRSPRAISSAIPRDLETILLRAISKDPAKRYAAAARMAEDLRHFLQDEPITARRPSWRERAVKWGRRHPSLATAIATCAFLLVLASVIGLLITARSAQHFARQQVDVNRRIGESLSAATGFYEQSRLAIIQDITLWARARELTRFAETLAAGEFADPTWLPRVQALMAQLDEQEAIQRLLSRLEDANATQLREKELSRIRIELGRETYDEAFRQWGINPDMVAPEQTSDRILAQPQPVRRLIIGHLDRWLGLEYIVGVNADPQRQAWLQAVLAACDAAGDDAAIWRAKLRQAQLAPNDDALFELATVVDYQSQPPYSLLLLGEELCRRKHLQEGIQVLKAAQQRHPGDIWLNYALYTWLGTTRPPRHEERYQYAVAAAAIFPDNPHVQLIFGHSLWAAGRIEEAVQYYRTVVERFPADINAYAYLAERLAEMGDVEAALKIGLAGKQVDPKSPLIFLALGNVYQAQGDFQGAVAANRKALELRPDFVHAHSNLGRSLTTLGELDAALVAFEKSVELMPEYWGGHYNIANILGAKGNTEGAKASYQKAIELNPDFPDAHVNLGRLLLTTGDLDAAVAATQRAIELKSPQSLHLAYLNLGTIQVEKGDDKAAIAAYQQAMELLPNHEAFITSVTICLVPPLLRQGEDQQALSIIGKVSESRITSVYNGVAWELATCLNTQQRNPTRAVEFGRQAVQREPNNRDCWNTLGVAHYRADELQDSITALDRSVELSKGGDASDWFFLAMAHGRLGHAQEARRWFDQAVAFVEQMDRPRDDLALARTEAAEVLGIEQLP
jgi:serine/threonine protein kinase/Tfp pilus assembly protein PilF